MKAPNECVFVWLFYQIADLKKQKTALGGFVLGGVRPLFGTLRHPLRQLLDLRWCQHKHPTPWREKQGEEGRKEWRTWCWRTMILPSKFNKHFCRSSNTYQMSIHISHAHWCPHNISCPLWSFLDTYYHSLTHGKAQHTHTYLGVHISAFLQE